MNLVEITKTGGVTVVRILVKRLLSIEEIIEFGEELFSIKGTDTTKVIIDFSKLEFLSAAALNKFILFDRYIKKSKGRISFFGLKEGVLEILTITRLRELFEIDYSEEDALEKVGVSV